MRNLLISLVTLLALAACGADGPPERPSAPAGITISGTVEAGIARDGD